ncbi:hypothetical protein CO046_03025 [Candidatus Peregrinibacteria bacterium CG_4_9_14_0_2_um_filter_53_11]|nr:MAG: hypothetical protein CO046_03025 [Candidatus Peregrinibacteria bacterium CG_4_9_14_0_2_um_filter_53_11]
MSALRKGSTILLLVLSLSGCFGGGDSAETPAPDGYTFFENEEFQIALPTEWEILDPGMLSSSVEPTTVLVARSNLRDPIFTANIVILKNPLDPSPEGQAQISARDYAGALRSKLKDTLSNYRELTAEEVTVPVGDTQVPTLFTQVEGRPASETDIKNYTHLSVVVGDYAYIVVGAARADAPVEGTLDKIQSAVRSLKIN